MVAERVARHLRACVVAMRQCGEQCAAKCVFGVAESVASERAVAEFYINTCQQQPFAARKSAAVVETAPFPLRAVGIFNLGVGVALSCAATTDFFQIYRPGVESGDGDGIGHIVILHPVAVSLHDAAEHPLRCHLACHLSWRI